MSRYGLTKEVIVKIIDVFARFQEVDVVLIYGSRAKGNFKNGSDIDLTIKGEKLNLSLLCLISNELDELLLPYTFDLSNYDQIDNKSLIEHINREGVVFYQKTAA